MREFVIVYMVELVDVGARFTRWPLHMTLLPWFEASDAEVVQRELTKKVAATRIFDVSVGERSTLGVTKRLPVMLIKPDINLQALHDKLLEMTAENGWRLRGRYTGTSFKPHVTQKAGQDAEGILHIDELAIVEAQPQNYRQVIGKVRLLA